MLMQSRDNSWPQLAYTVASGHFLEKNNTDDYLYTATELAGGKLPTTLL